MGGSTSKPEAPAPAPETPSKAAARFCITWAAWLFGWPANVEYSEHADRMKVQMIAGTVVTLSAAAVFSYLKVSRVLEKSAKCAAAHDSFRSCMRCCAPPEPAVKDPPLLAP